MIYLFHFHEKFHHAQHYAGCTNNIERRIKEHMGGDGNALIREIIDAGIGFDVYVISQDSFEFEKIVKKRKNNPKLCPCCNGRKGKLVYRYTKEESKEYIGAA